VGSLKAIELLVTKCKRSSFHQELVKKIVGGWRTDSIARIMEGTEITQEVFLNSATNSLNDGYITKMLHQTTPELVVTDLEVAATRENTRMLKLLLHTVEEMKMQDSVLEAAITKGRPKIFQMLLQHGLEDPILEASLRGAASEDDNLEMVKMLLAHTKGEDSATGDILQAVLGEAVDESSMSIVEHTSGEPFRYAIFGAYLVQSSCAGKRGDC
jgi:hypothetical protein